MNEFLLQNINYYGIRTEIKKLSEEIFELQEAILDYELDDTNIDGNYEHVIEEMADSFIILKQILLYYKITDEQLNDMMNRKMNRQKARLDKELQGD